MLELICSAGSFQATSVRSQEQTLILQEYLIKDIHTDCVAASRFSCWEGFVQLSPGRTKRSHVFLPLLLQTAVGRLRYHEEQDISEPVDDNSMMFKA